tara:strand:- start:9660 stop:10703 length:1044 start_codon:yes stop_codon:yes gene_type:complete
MNDSSIGMEAIMRFCRPTTLLLLALLGLSTGFAESAVAQSWADKMFAERSHDFRTVGRGAKAEYRFELENKFEEDVHIAGVRTSCGCTTPSITKETLQSREKGAVIATFNTNTFIGKKSATITVVFDKPYYAEVQLKVTGFIRTDITFDPPEVSFGELPSGQSAEREVVITHSGNSNWQITDVRSHCSDLQVRLNPPERSPGLVRYRMLVRLNKDVDEGELRERLTLISNDRDFPTTEMSISGRIRPSLTVSPASVSLGTATPNSVVERRLVIRGEEPFEITDVVCGDERFEFEVPGGNKKIQFVKLRFTADNLAGAIGQEIKVVTNLPGNKATKCTVTGTIAGDEL